MPLPVLLAAVGLVLGAVVGIQLFTWKVYAKGKAGPIDIDVGAGPTSYSWVPLALIGVGAYLLLKD